ncbi:HNH endonuclease [Pantoea phage Nufs112]|nr:HNH endonuclease [Pantoea phage Nufs112]
MWKGVSGWSGYQVSDNGLVMNKKTNRVLQQSVRNVGGYLSVTLYSSGKSKSLYVHRLVAIEFVDGYFLGAEVNHKDGDPTNNHYTNLEWVTSQQNHDHKVAMGLTSRKGLNADTDKFVMMLLASGKSEREVSRITGVSRPVVHRLH